MAGNAGGFEDDPMAPGCYSQLLFGDDISGHGCNFDFTPSFSPHDDDNNNNNDDDDGNYTPKMLCFGDYAKPSKTGHGPGPGPACNDTSLPVSNKKRKGSGKQESGSQIGAPTGNRSNRKKPKTDISTVSGHAKVAKKEKLGDRITALQQLVSPFGKTDTASVLHEALGYIRFLHDQVHVLCSPYLQRCHPDDGDSKESERRKNDLRSRGLCLVPVELTLHVADSNGADLWSPAAMFDAIPMS